MSNGSYGGYQPAQPTINRFAPSSPSPISYAQNYGMAQTPYNRQATSLAGGSPVSQGKGGGYAMRAQPYGGGGYGGGFGRNYPSQGKGGGMAQPAQPATFSNLFGQQAPSYAPATQGGANTLHQVLAQNAQNAVNSFTPPSAPPIAQPQYYPTGQNSFTPPPVQQPLPVDPQNPAPFEPIPTSTNVTPQQVGPMPGSVSANGLIERNMNGQLGFRGNTASVSPGLQFLQNGNFANSGDALRAARSAGVNVGMGDLMGFFK